MSEIAHDQIPLPIAIDEHYLFDNFLLGNNGEVVTTIQAHLVSPQAGCFYIWGAEGCGKSHLLLAICAAAGDCRPIYLDLATLAFEHVESVADTSELKLVCVDNVHLVEGDSRLERALFNLINSVQNAAGQVFFAARQAHHALQIDLPDLRSRLSSGPQYRLLALGDVEKMEVLRSRATERGIELSESAAKYLLTHAHRDLTSLSQLFNELDLAALGSRRQLTIPFIKSYLAAPSP